MVFLSERVSKQTRVGEKKILRLQCLSQNKRALTVFSCVKALTADKGVFLQLIKTKKKKKLRKNLWKTTLVKINEAIWFSLSKRYSRDSVKIQNSYGKQLSVLSVMINHTDGPRAYFKDKKKSKYFSSLPVRRSTMAHHT